VILYLHGFTSGPQSQKARLLGARAAERGIEFICPQLSHSPTAAIELAEGVVARKVGAGDTVALVGSSLGGYYATWLAEKHGLRAVLVNPAVVAHISLEKFIGPQQNIYSGERFDFTREHIGELRSFEVARLSHPENVWLLVEAGDEVLDYRQAVTRYAGARQTVLAGGDHSFTRWAEVLDQVIDFANEHPV
jgi:uncharacterized protein